MSFAAYLVSFLPLDNDSLRESRSEITKRQIGWWLEKTSLDIHVISMNYREEDFLPDNSRLIYHNTSPKKLAPARLVGFELFYASDYDFGIMMDDDAILYDKEHHNSGPKLFEEMDAQLDQYRALDVFFPINPQKVGFNPIWEKDPILYRDNHVFKRNLDLKGSMFVVRNFRKYETTEVYPDIEFNWQEDTKFALDCLAAGKTVMQCHNIVLNELSGSASHFSADASSRIPKMKAGNEKIAAQYEHLGLTMIPDSHLLEKSEFIKRTWGDKPTSLAVSKQSNDLFIF